MNHRLKFRWEPNRFDNLVLQEVWCPGDHGGDCDCPEVVENDACVEPWFADFCTVHEDPLPAFPEQVDCPDCKRYVVAYGVYEDAEPHVPTGNCWAKESLELFVAESDGWQECLKGSIDLPWVAVTISGPGPDGNEELFVNVVAEVAVVEETNE